MYDTFIKYVMYLSVQTLFFDAAMAEFKFQIQYFISVLTI
jgi:hypothetical protein